MWLNIFGRVRRSETHHHFAIPVHKKLGKVCIDSFLSCPPALVSRTCWCAESALASK